MSVPLKGQGFMQKVEGAIKGCGGGAERGWKSKWKRLGVTWLCCLRGVLGSSKPLRVRGQQALGQPSDDPLLGI